MSITSTRNSSLTADRLRHPRFTKFNKLLGRVSALRKKAAALNKQANAYQQAAESINDVGREILLEDSTTTFVLIPIGGVLPLSRKKLGR